MRTRKRIISLFLAFVLIISLAPVALADDGPNIEDIALRTHALLVANAETGEIYYSKNPDKVLGIASMTKLMTYLIIKDEIAQGKYKLEDIVKVDKLSASFASPGNSRMDLAEGEQISVEDLLAGLMVVSGNDAATALAIKSAKTPAAFVKKMNAKAKELGLKDYHFINSTGLTEEKIEKKKKVEDYNKMPASSLFKLAKHIVDKYPEVEEYGKMKNLSMPERNYVGEHTHNMHNTIPGLLGLKTGYTPEAGYNFTGYVDMNTFSKGQKFRLITVVTGAETEVVREEATTALIKYVDNNFKYKDLLDYDLQYPVVDFEALDTKQGYFPLYLEGPVEGIFPKRANPELSYSIFEDKKAPFEDGEVLGEVTVKYDGKELAKVNLINKGYKARLDFFSRFMESFKDVIKKLMLIF